LQSFRGQKSPILLLYISIMITAENIRRLIEKDLEVKGFFLVDVKVSSSNKILVYVDTLYGITLDDCAVINRLIESKIDRDKEDYELEVSSPGLSNPLRLPIQYQKNMGKPLRVVKTDGETKEGNIIQADTDKVTLEIALKKILPGKKTETKVQLVEISYASIKTAKLLI
jgi:ribosome maturation factor RimP